MATERNVVLDQPKIHEEQSDAVRQATERAERAEAELARLTGNTGPTQSASGAGTEQALKRPPSPSTAHAVAGDDAVNQDEMSTDAETGSDPSAFDELRKDSMMVHLLDSLEAGKDIGHYGRLVFSMVARHFLPHEEVLAWLTRDPDFSAEQATLMLRQVEGKDYTPPKRDRILDWQKQQEFPIIPDPEDPDSGNLYRNLKFPDEIYKHIGNYQEQKLESEHA